jgi:membrane dipeptidase
MTDQNVISHAKALHNKAIIIDGHSDILMPIADGKIRLGDLVQIPDPKTWEPPLGLVGEHMNNMYGFSAHTIYFNTMGQYSVPQFLQGGLTVQVAAIYLRDEDLERALERGLEMTWCLHRDVDENDDLELVTTVKDIHRIKREGKCGCILSFEGFEPLGFDLRFLDLFYKLGLRMASLSHSRRNFFADGMQSGIKTGGLTKLGKEAIRRMDELGIVVDLGHLNQEGFWDIMELCTKPVVYSHIRACDFFPARPEDSPYYPALDLSRGHERLKAIADTGGVVGIIFYSQADVDAVVTDIEYVMDVVGPDHVGLGSDLYGMERAPKGLEDMSKIPSITERMVERGHSDEVILKVLGGNYMRVFEQVWK